MTNPFEAENAEFLVLVNAECQVRHQDDRGDQEDHEHAAADIEHSGQIRRPPLLESTAIAPADTALTLPQPGP